MNTDFYLPICLSPTPHVEVMTITGDSENCELVPTEDPQSGMHQRLPGIFLFFFKMMFPIISPHPRTTAGVHLKRVGGLQS